MPYPNTKEMNDSIYSKSKPLHLVNIWNDDINNEVNDSCHEMLQGAENKPYYKHNQYWTLWFMIWLCCSIMWCVKLEITNFITWKFHKIFILYEDGKFWIL